MRLGGRGAPLPAIVIDQGSEMSEGTAQHDPPSAEFLEEIDAASERLDGAPAGEIISWAVTRFGGNVAVAASFQDPVLVALAVAADPTIEIVFLDTEYHFPETLAYVERLRKQLDLNLRVTHPEIALDEWPCGTARCCELRKVAPLAKALDGRQAWITGLKRVDTADACRRARHLLGRGAGHGEDEPDRRVDRRRGRRLHGRARAAAPPPQLRGLRLDRVRADHAARRRRASTRAQGRWAGMDKTECGLHL